jgi:hypothetical protein
MAALPAATATVEASRGEPALSGVSLRRVPYPYLALLAICSDLDETPDRRVYAESMRFLNTTEVTRMGPGVGLEVGNSMYFDMPPTQFAYWNTDDAGRAMVRVLIRSGHIDSLHSFGDLASTRSHAGRALDELSRHDCQLTAWIDHGVAPSNFGADIMRGRGDVPGSDVYHADLTCGYGIEYVWRGRVTSVTGQDVARRLRGIYSGRHPIASTRTLVKELLKGVLGRGLDKYDMHAPNQILREARLRSGHRVLEFLRANPHWGGVSCGETAEGLPDVLTESMLTRLVQREGVCILYTHLGKVRRPDEPFAPRTRDAFRRLADFHREGKILVTTTRRLLRYCRAVRQVRITATTDGDGLRVDVGAMARASARPWLAGDLAGLSLYVSDPARTRITLSGREVDDLRRNPPDHTGRPSVSLPWPPLEFPRL